MKPFSVSVRREGKYTIHGSSGVQANIPASWILWEIHHVKKKEIGINIHGSYGYAAIPTCLALEWLLFFMGSM